MAEGALALLLALAYKVDEKQRAARAGEWGSRTSIIGRGLNGRVLGIIGLVTSAKSLPAHQ